MCETRERQNNTCLNVRRPTGPGDGKQRYCGANVWTGGGGGTGEGSRVCWKSQRKNKSEGCCHGKRMRQMNVGWSMGSE